MESDFQEYLVSVQEKEEEPRYGPDDHNIMPRITVTDIDRRIIQVFLSSTFVDLDSERSYLARQVFPSLRAKLMKYNITLMDIDLRWGITEDEVKSGKTVKLCLEQIENTRPFFIGILGNRYGWVPEQEYLKDISLTENDREKSLTEIEIRHGALDLPEDSDAAFFFKDTKDDFGEDEYKKCRLSELKNQLKDSRYPVEPFQSKEELGILVENTVMSWVKKYYDLETIDRKGLINAEQRHRREGYLDGFVTCEGYERIIDSFIASVGREEHSNVLPIAGAGGAGKRAFSAYAAKCLKEKGFVQDIVQYYFEDNCGMQGVEDAVTYLTDSMKSLFGDLDTKDYLYKYSLPEVLNRLLMHIMAAPQDRHWVLVLGGINLLPKKEFEDWVRMISIVPESVIIIFTSTLRFDNRPILEKYFGEKFRTVGGSCFGNDERSEIIRQYFKSYGKTLNEEYIEAIINSRTHISGFNVFHNMGHLHLMLNELRIFGDYDHIGSYVANLTECASDESRFLSLLVDNWSRAFDYKGNRMVETVLNLLATLDYGLDEKDILDYVKTPETHWQQFLATSDSFLYMQDGRYYMHNVYRSSFNVIFTDTIKSFRYDWVTYIEKKVAEENYVPDYKIYELISLYRSLHYQLYEHFNGKKPDYYVPECFTAELRYNPDELLDKLFAMAGNIDWMTWLLDRGESILLKKIFGYLEQRGRDTELYLSKDGNEMMKLACIYEAVGYYFSAIRACTLVNEDSLNIGEKLRLYQMLTRLYHDTGDREMTVESAHKALYLCEVFGDEILPKDAKMEIEAMLLDSLPLEKADKNLLVDFIENAGEITLEKLKSIEIVLDLLQQKFNGNNEMVDMVCDMRITIYETIGVKDGIRCKIARAYMQKAISLNNMNKLEDSFDFFYVAYNIFDAVKSDDSVAEEAYTAYMLATLANVLRISIDYWQILSNGLSCMALLLYHSRGWDDISWLMERILGYMESLVSLPEWEDKKDMYIFHREEFNRYLKRRKS